MNIRRFLAVKRMCKCRTGFRRTWTPLGRPRIRRPSEHSRLEEMAHLNAAIAGGRTRAQAELLITGMKP